MVHAPDYSAARLLVLGGAVCVSALLLTVLFSLPSCNAPESAAPVSGAARLQETLRLPLDSDVPTMDPIHITDVRSAAVARQVFSTLVRYDQDLKLIPDLVERWEVSPDKLRLAFHLRKGVKFHHGREVTANDFVYSFNRLADPSEVSERATLLRDVVGYQEFREGKADRLAGLTAPDEYTLHIELSKPYSPFLASLAMINFAVVPREEVEKAPPDQPGYWSRHVVGSGPFQLGEWKPDSYIVLNAFPGYFRGTPSLKSIVYKVIPDLNTQFNAYENGELDATNIPVGQLRRLSESPDYKNQYHRKDLVAIQYYVFNMEQEPWKDRLFASKKALRQALNYAINREYIADEILEGRFQPFVGIIPPALTEWYNPENRLEPRYTYDVNRARKLLEEAGHPQGMFLPDDFPMYYNSFSVYPQVALQIEDFLRDISVRVDPQVLEWTTFLDTMRRGEFIFGRSGWVADYPDPDTFLWQLLASENAGWHDNWARYRNPVFDELVEKARVEFDPDKRRLLYWQAEKIALEDAPWLFLFAQTANVLIRPEVQGIKLSGMDVDASFPNNDLFNVKVLKPAEETPPESG